MERNKTSKVVIAFSLNKTSKPKFNASQIRIGTSKQKGVPGIPKPTRKLVVGRSGKIGYEKDGERKGGDE